MLRVKLKWISFEVRKFSGDLLTGLVLLIFFQCFYRTGLGKRGGFILVVLIVI